MNERIKELAFQASENYDYHPEFAKKFAELIVRECALFMETNTKVNDDGEVVDAPHAWQMIDHFGTKCLTFTFRS